MDSWISRLRGRVERWWTEDLWTLAHEAAGPPIPGASRLHTALARFGLHAAQCIYIVATGFHRERIKLRAAQLTYVTLLSFVPGLVVVFSVITLVAGSAEVENWLRTYVMESLAISRESALVRELERLMGETRAVGSFGFLFLFATVLSLLGNIEGAFNDIWGVRRNRTFLQRFQVYWPLVTVGPVLLLASLSLTASLQASRVVKALESTGLVAGFELAAYFFTVGFLTLLYLFLPNTRVPLRSALVGGMVAGTLWECAKRLYALYAVFILSRPSVYGSLAAVPLYILWVYVSWIIALLGATLAFAVQNARTFEPEDPDQRPASQRDRELLAARLLVVVSDAFDRGQGPVPGQQLLDRATVPPRLARRVLAELVEHRLLVETAPREGEETAFVPGRPLAAISMADVVRAMRRDAEPASRQGAVVIREDDALGQRVLGVLLDAEGVVEARLGPRSLAELVHPPSDGSVTR